MNIEFNLFLGETDVKKILIVGINGSPNKDGMGSTLLAETLAGAQIEGAEIKIVHLVDWMKRFHSGIFESRPAELEPLYELMEEADGFVFSTPVQWFGPSDLMTSFINHLTAMEMDDFMLEGKVAGFIATCNEDGGQAACAKMMSALTHMGCLCPPYATLYHNSSMASGENSWQNKDAGLIGKNLVKLARVTQRIDWGY